MARPHLQRVRRQLTPPRQPSTLVNYARDVDGLLVADIYDRSSRELLIRVRGSDKYTQDTARSLSLAFDDLAWEDQLRAFHRVANDA